MKLLEEFLLKTVFIVDTCVEHYTIQANESLHRLKLKYACKDVKWGFTNEARMTCAVLDRNEIGWKLKLKYDHLGLPPLCPDKYDKLWKMEHARISRKLRVHSDGYQRWQLEERRKKWRWLKMLCYVLRILSGKCYDYPRNFLPLPCKQTLYIHLLTGLSQWKSCLTDLLRVPVICNLFRRGCLLDDSVTAEVVLGVDASNRACYGFP